MPVSTKAEISPASRRRFLAATGLAGLAALLPVRAPRADSGPSADLWARWEHHDPADRRPIDHRAFGRFLHGHVIPGAGDINLIDYGAVSRADREVLDGYVAAMQSVPISGYSRAEQLPYWINLYNAATVKLVLDHYPIASITDVPLGGWFSFGPWDAEILTVENEAVSLNDIEHRILRPIWRDARLHYAVNCASLGCPNLARRPYTAAEMDRMLDAGARAYVNHPRGVSIQGTEPAPEVLVSSIYDWFASDFERQDGSVIDHLLRYVDPAKTAAIRKAGSIHDHSYDWRLNDLHPVG